MAALLIYSFKLSVCLGVIYLFYYLVLRNLTFYNWNRYYLLVGTGLSFLIPLINVVPFLESPQANRLKLIAAIPTLNNLSSPVLYAGPASNSFEDYWYYIILIVFGLGVLIQVGRLSIQFISFFRIRRSAVQLQNGAINIYLVEEEIAPFSFGNAIFLNKNLLQSAELEEIIRHEKVHIEQKHTLDVLLFECVCLVNWFNPFAWWLRLAARQNLEFIVDRAVLVSPGLDKKYYQYLLLKVIGLPNLKITNQFNISSLQTRIKMMNKMPSNKRELAKFLFVLPMMAVLLLACQEDITLTEANKVSSKLGQEVAPPPPPPVPELPPPPPVVLPSSPDHTSFMKRNPQIELLGWQGDKTAVIFLKSGEREEYDLNNPEIKAKAEKKYGKLPEPNLPEGVTQFTPPVIKKN